MGHVIKQQAGTKYYKIVEEIRLNSKNYRATKNEKYLNEIFKLLKNLKPEEIYVITKSFTLFFYLSNIAEQVFREHFLEIKKMFFSSDGILYENLKSSLKKGEKTDLNEFFDRVKKLNLKRRKKWSKKMREY